MADAFIARQPILNQYGTVEAFELLHRSGTLNRAVIQCPQRANAETLHNFLHHFGPRTVVEDSRGFINADTGFLDDNLFDLLPPDQVVIELQPETIFTRKQTECIRRMAEYGYQVALDGFRMEPWYLERYRAILGYSTYFKVDLKTLSSRGLQQQIPRARHLGRKLIASRIETREEFVQCHRLGFDFFQGYFLGKPQILQSRQEPTNAAAIRTSLSAVDTADFNLADAIHAISHSPDLVMCLLRYLHKGACSIGAPLLSIDQLLENLGEDWVASWLHVQLKMNAKQASGPQDQQCNHISQAHARAASMRRLCSQCLQGRFAQAAPVAYLAGFLDSLLEQGDLSESQLRQLGLHQHVEQAIRARDGLLGQLLHGLDCWAEGASHINDLSAELGMDAMEFERCLEPTFCQAAQTAGQVS